jgi:hypothetical protein
MYFETGDKILEVNAKLTERINIVNFNLEQRLHTETSKLKEELDYYKTEIFHLKMELGRIRDYIRLPWYKKIFRKL